VRGVLQPAPAQLRMSRVAGVAGLARDPKRIWHEVL